MLKRYDIEVSNKPCNENNKFYITFEKRDEMETILNDFMNVSNEIQNQRDYVIREAIPYIFHSKRKGLSEFFNFFIEI